MTSRTTPESRRSPAYPNIPLEEALARLVELHTVLKDKPADLEELGEAWGLKSPAYISRIIAALRYFGLVKYAGRSGARRIVLSENGRRYVQTQDANIKAKVVKAVALRPRNIAKFSALWGRKRPADDACIDELVQKHRFTRHGALGFLRSYDDTIALLGTTESDDRGLANGRSQQSEKSLESLRDVSRQRVAFPLAEGEVTLLFPTSMSIASAKIMATLLGLALDHALEKAEQQESGPSALQFNRVGRR